MPFLNEIVYFINESLKAGSLNKVKLQPQKFYGSTTTVFRSGKDKNPQNVEPIPAVIEGDGKITLITPDGKMAMQVYHKTMGKTYNYEKKSYGDDYFIKSSMDMQMVVITNSKISGKTKDVLEPVFIFGIPQRLSASLIDVLGINNCLITPVSSNMDSMSVFRQEYPKSNYFLNEQMSLFLVRYKIELTFSQSCVDACLCD